MSTLEMSLEFDLLYNNIMSNAAPGIDEYEKSVFLTKAQEEIVQAIYDGSFEGSERMRESLGILVRTKRIPYSNSADRQTVVNFYHNKLESYSYGIDDNGNDFAEEEAPNMSSDSRLFICPKDLMFVVYEALEVPLSADCGENKTRTVLVKPVTHDEYYRAINNPFRRPRKREAFRLDSSLYIMKPIPDSIITEIKTDDNGVYSEAYKLLEIIYPKKFYPETGYTYVLRYIRKPQPIIIPEDLSKIADGLSIDDCWLRSECELNPVLHRAIVNRAVQLAISAYKTVSQEDNK